MKTYDLLVGQTLSVALSVNGTPKSDIVLDVPSAFAKYASVSGTTVTALSAGSMLVRVLDASDTSIALELILVRIATPTASQFNQDVQDGNKTISLTLNG